MTIPFWHDQSRDLLVYDSPVPERLAKELPGSIRLHNGYVAVPRTLYNLQYLRYLQHPITEPMAHYDWPGQYKPFEAQTVTANFLCVNPRAFVLSDMGTGKTLAALWAADFIMQQNPGMRAVIIAPLSTLQRVWADAIFQNFLGRRTFVVVHGTSKKREQLLAEPHDFYILNYDGLSVGAPGPQRGGSGENSHPRANQPRGLYKALLDRQDIRVAIVDEASAYRDGTTRRHRTARQLLQPRDYLWLMTGTPTPNGPTDAHGMAKLVNNAFGESFTSFKSRVMYKATQWKWVARQGAHAEAMKLLQPSIRFAIEDCVDLPPCTVQQREVDLSAAQRKAYDALERDLVLAVKDKKVITAANEAVLRLKLIQIACGAIYGEDREVHLVDASPRLAALHEILEQTNQKIIVFAPLTSVLNMLNRELKNYSRAVINGKVSMKERNQIFADFQNTPAEFGTDENGKTIQRDAAVSSGRDIRVLLADPGTMSHGLTLVAASVIVWFGPTDRTELYLQANARINRPGQTRSTSVVQIVSTPIEREIFKRLQNNETMQGVMLQMIRETR